MNKRKLYLFVCSFLLQSICISAEKSPFRYACRDKKSKSIIDTSELDSGFWSNKMPRFDTDKRVRIVGLINLYLKSVESRIQRSDNLLSNFEYCMNHTNESRCDEIMNWLTKEIPNLVKEARFHISLAQSPNNFATWIGRADHSVNTDLSVWSTYKDLSWESMTKEEIILAKQTLSDYKKEINIHAQNFLEKKKISASHIEKYKEETLIKIRYQHYLKYKLIMGQILFLQHISSESPTKKDILNALASTREILEKEKIYIKTKKRQFINVHDISQLVKNDLLEILDYKSSVEATLIQNPRYCNLAAALENYKQRRSLKLGLGLMIPIVGVSMLLPPAAGVGAGVLTGVGFIGYEQHELQQSNLRNLGHIYGSQDGDELDEISSIKKMRDFSVVIMPIGFGIFGNAFKKVGGLFGFKSLIPALKITRHNLFPKNIKSISNIISKYSRKKLFF